MKVLQSAVRVVAGAGLLVTIAVAPARAQILFFNGTFDGVGGLSSERNTIVSQSMVFDDFIVGGSGWTVNALFGGFLSDFTWTTADYEIRTGVSAGNGGSLLFSGTVAATHVATGATGFGYSEFTAGLTGLSFFLAPGTYWLGISPVGTGTGRAFLSTTSHTGGVLPVNDDLAFFNSTFFSANFADASGFNGVEDYSYGVVGTLGPAGPGDVVPEPSTIMLLATGLVGFAGTARRRRVKR